MDTRWTLKFAIGMGTASWTVLDELEVGTALKQSLNICIASPEYPLPGVGTSSGVGSAAESLAHGLVEHGHRVTVVTLVRERTPSSIQDGLTIHYLTSGQLHWYLLKIPWLGKRLSLPVREIERSWAFARCIGALHRQQAFDVIEGTESDSFFLGATKRSTPLVIRLHGEEYTFMRHTPGMTIPFAHQLSRRLQRFALCRATALIAPSQAHAISISAELNKQVGLITVIPHALDSIWRRWQKQLSDTPRQSIVLFVGRLERGKGILDALHCFEHIAHKVPNAQLVVIGSYHSTIPAATLTDLIDQLGIAERVHLLGHLPHEQLATWYARAQVFIMPSYYETFGLVALEAMTFGLPVVAYRTGALPEVVVEGQTGSLVEPGNIPELANTVISLLQDTPRRERMSRAAERHARTFDLARYVQATVEVYRRVIDKTL